MKRATGVCAFMPCYRVKEMSSREVDQAGNSGLPETNSEAPGVRARTGHSIRPLVVHYLQIRICARCGRRSGATTLKSSCLQILAPLFPLPGALKFLQRNRRGKTFF